MVTGAAPLPIASGHERQGKSSGAALAYTSPLRSHSHIWTKMASQMKDTAVYAVCGHVFVDVLGKSISEMWGISIATG